MEQGAIGYKLLSVHERGLHLDFSWSVERYRQEGVGRSDARYSVGGITSSR